MFTEKTLPDETPNLSAVMAGLDPAIHALATE
jgi:hypothetical protein